MSSVVGLGSREALSVPIMGSMLRLWGLEGVDPHHMRNLMKKEKSIGLVPGGFE